MSMAFRQLYLKHGRTIDCVKFWKRYRKSMKKLKMNIAELLDMVAILKRNTELNEKRKKILETFVYSSYLI